MFISTGGGHCDMTPPHQQCPPRPPIPLYNPKKLDKTLPIGMGGLEVGWGAQLVRVVMSPCPPLVFISCI